MSPIIGNSPRASHIIPGKLTYDFIHDPIKTLTYLTRQYGGISHFTLGLQKNMYFINNPDYIEQILISGHHHFQKNKTLPPYESLLGEGLVTSEGEYHDSQRRLIQPIFNPKQIMTFGKVMIDHAIRTSLGWKHEEVLDIHQEMMQLTLGIICKSVLNYEIKAKAQEVGKALTAFHSSRFGGSGILLLALLSILRRVLHHVEESESQKTDKALTTGGKVTVRLQRSIGRVLDKISTSDKLADSRDAKMQLDSIVYGLIANRRTVEKGSEDSNNKDLLSRLIQAEAAGNMSDLQLRDEIMTIFVAGHETTANALTWTFYLLSQNPTIEEKLHKEVDSILDNGNAIPSVQDIPRLQYTESIFRESLRLFPPIWSIRRNVKTDFRLGEYTIRTGSSIIMSPYVMHHDLRYYKEPERFNPDRWTKEFKNGLPRFSFFPFGGGARSCIGESFAWMEGVLVIAYLAQKWVMRLIPDQIVKLDAGSVLRPKYGIKMKVNLRKRN